MISVNFLHKWINRCLRMSNAQILYWSKPVHEASGVPQGMEGPIKSLSKLWDNVQLHYRLTFTTAAMQTPATVIRPTHTQSGQNHYTKMFCSNIWINRFPFEFGSLDIASELTLWGLGSSHSLNLLKPYEISLVRGHPAMAFKCVK